MNGPQNYREAEQALRYAFSGDDANPELTVAAAQVHATLALAAATADQGVNPDGERAWREVTS